MHRANHEDWDRDLEQRLQAWLVTQPEDPDTLFTLGLIEKRRGNSAQAEKWYQRAISQSPEFSEAYSNLGNVYLARKETNAALTSYQKAVDLDPMKAAYHYNLSRAYSEEAFLSGKKDQEFQRARQLDPQLIDYYSAIDAFHGTPHINRFVIDEALSSERLWERFLSHFVGKEGWMFRLFHAWFEKIPSRLSFLTPVLFLLFLIGMSRYSRAKRFLTRCPMCGSPTHRFYLGASDQEFICFNCYRIFVQKEKLHPKIVEKKSLQVREFQKAEPSDQSFRLFLLCGFCLPLERILFPRSVVSLCVFCFCLEIHLLERYPPSAKHTHLSRHLESSALGRVFYHFLFVGAPADVSNEMGTGKRVCRGLKLPAPAYWQAVSGRHGTGHSAYGEHASATCP